MLIGRDDLGNDINDRSLIKFFVTFQVVSEGSLMAVFQNQIVGGCCFEGIEAFHDVGMRNALLYP